MIMKYKVPKKYEKLYGKGVVYCEIIQAITINKEVKLYKVRMINRGNFSNVFMNSELKKLNIIDKIILSLNFKKGR